MLGLLPNFFKFKSTNDLVRIGRDNDGGYLVSRNDIDNSDILISFGISDDWSFEVDFVNKKEIPLIAFDPFINKDYFLKKIKESICKFYRIKKLFYNLKLYFSYKKFFTGNRQHIQKFIGTNKLINHNKERSTLKEIFNDIEHNNIFLKIDIEGSEYSLLDDLIYYQERIRGMVIEFHNCDVNILKLEIFIKKIHLNLIHIHPNNYTGINQNGLPITLELTFSKNNQLFNIDSLPHILDMPNNKSKNEIFISFYN
jgi:hypothetical protein